MILRLQASASQWLLKPRQPLDTWTNISSCIVARSKVLQPNHASLQQLCSDSQRWGVPQRCPPRNPSWQHSSLVRTCAGTKHISWCLCLSIHYWTLCPLIGAHVGWSHCVPTPLQTCRAYSLVSKRLLLTQHWLVILVVWLRNEVGHPFTWRHLVVGHPILQFVLGQDEPHSREIRDSATKPATNLQTPQSVHDVWAHQGKIQCMVFQTMLPGMSCNAHKEMMVCFWESWSCHCSTTSHIFLYGAIEAPTKGGTCIGLQSAGKGSPPENVKQGQFHWVCCEWGGSAFDHESNLPSENPAEFLAGFSCRGSTFSRLGQLASSNRWACAKRMGAPIIPNSNVGPIHLKRFPVHASQHKMKTHIVIWLKPHCGLQSSPNARPQSAREQLDFRWPKEIFSQIFDGLLTKKRYTTQGPNAQIGQNVDQHLFLIFLLINKNVNRNFVDQQNS